MLSKETLLAIQKVSQLQMSPINRQFTAVNGSSFTCTSTVVVPVSVQHELVHLTFHAVNSLAGFDVILGRDFLSRGYSLHFHESTVQLSPLSVPVSATIPNPISVSSSTPISTQVQSPQLTPNLHMVEFPPQIEGPLSSSFSKLMINYSVAFAKNVNDIGRTNKISHCIVTSGPPVKCSPYKLPHHLLADVRNEISSMLKHGIIEKSSSPYCSPILLVPKPDGNRRFCVDFRRLNDQTEKDVYPMPSIEESLNRLSKCNFFSTLDLVSGFWQIPLDPNSKHKTAFQFEGELYQFTVMPFGVCNGPASFQRLMNEVLQDCKPFATAYLDDIVIFSQTEEAHLLHISCVLRALISAGLKAKVSKCKFLTTEITFLGHKVSKDGVCPLENRVTALEHYPAPTSSKAVRRFLGMASFYRRHIPHFAELAGPLEALTHKGKKFVWSSECHETFQKLKSAIASSAVLILPDFSQQFHLHVDASGTAVGAVLSQFRQGALLPVAYASRKLTDPETRYSTIDRETLALSWGCTHFYHYLYGKHFNAYSDHKPLLGLLSSQKLSPRQFRLLETLCNFDFTLQYIEGKKNLVADALSRPVASVQQEQHLLNAQSTDPFCTNVTRHLSDSKTVLPNDAAFKFFLKHRQDFTLSSAGELRFRGLVIVPKSIQKEMLEKFHEGHYGSAKMLWRIRQRFWWYGLPTAVQNFTRSCISCAQGKTSGSIRCSEGHLPSPGPYELVFIDIVGPLPAYNNYRYILTMEDSFTKFVRAVPLNSISADVIATTFYRQWIQTFHAPSRLHSDNGTQFTSITLSQLCNSLGISQSHSTPYHPQGNGGIERFHKTLKERLRCFENPNAWPVNIYSAVLAYNSTIHAATGTSPFMMAFGFQPDPPGLWSSEFRRGDSPLTSDLRQVWSHVPSSPGQPATPSRILKAGDLVLVRLPNPAPLTKPWSLPKKIVSIIGPTTAEVEGFGRIHFCRLKYFQKGEGCKE